MCWVIHCCCALPRHWERTLPLTDKEPARSLTKNLAANREPCHWLLSLAKTLPLTEFCRWLASDKELTSLVQNLAIYWQRTLPLRTRSLSNNLTNDGQRILPLMDKWQGTLSVTGNLPGEWQRTLSLTEKPCHWLQENFATDWQRTLSTDKKSCQWLTKNTGTDWHKSSPLTEQKT